MRIIYLDNPDQCVCVMRRCFSDLGKDLVPGDSGLRLDNMHFCSKIMDVSNNNHPGLDGAIKELREVMHIVHADDLGLPTDKQRKLKLPPHVSREWGAVGDP